ncbi:murein transglycosylase A [Desulfatirhabdium butyrativorans]|uniref:murein transglycosylase A n=1 Tax=Desulfatirhabdium butyrativorans TaxID=340467 RepID=UPI000688B0CE|nr:MltA domain-containing protein [Desulfatirhabdium butyrativorans]
MARIEGPAHRRRVVHMGFWIIAALLALSMGFAGCFRWKTPVAEAPMALLDESQYPTFSDDESRSGLLEAIDASLGVLSKMPDQATQSFGKDTYTVSWIRNSLAVFRKFLESAPTAEAIDRFVQAHYRVYRSAGSDGEGRVLFTGYYEPEIDGCLLPQPGCETPVYGVPADLVRIDLGAFSTRFSGEKIVGRVIGHTVVPYWERRDIENPAVFRSEVDVLAWVRDPVAFFFLQVQGSGKIRLPSGERISIHYAASNGRPYRSIGKLMLDEGIFAAGEVSMQGIRRYLQDHPERVPEILQANPSYVFFEKVPAGPLGSLGVPLTACRSIALDHRIFPKGGLAYIRTRKPARNPAADHPASDGKMSPDWIPFGRFVLVQDTGGAITGPGRADLFCGSGPEAEWVAGHLQHPGELFFLVLKPSGSEAAAPGPANPSPLPGKKV